jgi:hypothetical protein
MIELFDHFSPHALLVPAVAGGGIRRRGILATRTIRTIVGEAVRRGIAVHVVGADSVKLAVGECRGQPVQNKNDIYREVLEHFPELTAAVPRPRTNIWQPESYQTPLFNAVAMYLAWSHLLSKRDSGA